MRAAAEEYVVPVVPEACSSNDQDPSSIVFWRNRFRAMLVLLENH